MTARQHSGIIVREVDMMDTTNRDDFNAMQDVCFPGDYIMAPEAVLDQNEIAWWFAYDAADEFDQPVGFACLTRGHTVRNVGYLAWAGVMPSHRGQGLQKRLIQARVQRATKWGCQRALSYTRAYNPASGNNLAACGFRMYTPSVNWAWEGALALSHPKQTLKPEADILYWQRKLAA